MAFRTVLGKLFLSDRDRQTIDADLRVVEKYTAEVLEQERLIEEERKAAEAREAARKAKEEKLAAIRKAEQERLAKKRAEEAKKAEPEKKKAEFSYQERFSPMAPADHDGPRFSLAFPSHEEEEEKPKAKKSEAKYSILEETGRYSLEVEEHEPADLFGFNSPYGIDDILTNLVIGRTIHRDMTFSEKMSQLMGKYGFCPADVYKAGNVDKSLFSRLLSNPDYMPSKDTAVSIALAMKLSLEEAEDLLRRAGYTLSHAMRRDIVLECCFKKKIFNVIEVNIILDRLGYKPLSRIPT